MSTKAEDEKVMQNMVDAMNRMPADTIKSIPEVVGQFLVMSPESLVVWAGKPGDVMAAQFMAYLKSQGRLTEVMEATQDSAFKAMIDVIALCPSKATRVDGGSR